MRVVLYEDNKHVEITARPREDFDPLVAACERLFDRAAADAEGRLIVRVPRHWVPEAERPSSAAHLDGIFRVVQSRLQSRLPGRVVSWEWE